MSNPIMHNLLDDETTAMNSYIGFSPLTADIYGFQPALFHNGLEINQAGYGYAFNPHDIPKLILPMTIEFWYKTASDFTHDYDMLLWNYGGSIAPTGHVFSQTRQRPFWKYRQCSRSITGLFGTACGKLV